MVKSGQDGKKKILLSPITLMFAPWRPAGVASHGAGMWDEPQAPENHSNHWTLDQQATDPQHSPQLVHRFKSATA